MRIHAGLYHPRYLKAYDERFIADRACVQIDCSIERIEHRLHPTTYG